MDGSRLSPSKKAGREVGQAELDDPNVQAARAHAHYLRIEANEAITAAGASSLWELADVTLVGRHLLAEVQLSVARQTVRHRLLVSKGGQPTGSHISHSLKPLQPEDAKKTRQDALDNCGRMLRSCGGYEVLQLRNDDCTRFVEETALKFRLTGPELSAAKHGPNFSPGRAEIELAAHPNAEELEDAEIAVRGLMRAKGMSSLWKFDDPSAVGALLLARERYHAEKQSIRRKRMLWEEPSRMLDIKGSIAKRSRVAALREYALDCCARLAKMSGGFQQD